MITLETRGDFYCVYGTWSVEHGHEWVRAWASRKEMLALRDQLDALLRDPADPKAEEVCRVTEGTSACGHAAPHEHCWPGIGHLCGACHERLNAILGRMAAAMLAHQSAAPQKGPSRENVIAAADWGKAVSDLADLCDEWCGPGQTK